jgi:ankyrin repeat protein
MKSILIKIVAAVAAVVLVGVWLLMPSPIHRAANNGNIEAVKQHLADSVDVDAKCWELFAGFTLLYLAAGEGHKEIVELLIAEGADVHAKDKWGYTPLHSAAMHDHKEIAELLIAKGADVNVKIVSGPNQGSTPLDAANGTNHPKIADLLRKHGGKTGEELKAKGK